MPAFNKPAGQWLGQQLAQAKGTLAAVAAQTTEYIVDSEGVCQAIIGHLVAEPNGTATGLEGWGVAVRSATGWISLGADSGWVAPSLEHSWTNAGGGNSAAGYRKQGNVVRLRGLLTGGEVAKSVFVLPTGFRPTGNETFASGSASGAEDNIAVTAAGVVVFQGGTAPYYSLAGITFTID